MMCFPHISLNLHASSDALPIIKAVFLYALGQHSTPIIIFKAL
jgi:hypothetical protein